MGEAVARQIEISGQIKGTRMTGCVIVSFIDVYLNCM